LQLQRDQNAMKIFFIGKKSQQFTRSTIHNEGFEKNKLFVVAINSRNVLILKSCAESDLH